MVGFLPFSYAVESSSNLLDWSLLTTNAPPFIILDPASRQTPQRFFRSYFFPDSNSWDFLPD